MIRNTLCFSVIALLGLPSLASAHDTSRAKAAELGLHRIERLVILRKINASFQTQTETLSIQLLQQRQPTDPFFKATITQGKAADGSQRTVDLMMDDDGKTLSFTEVGGTDPARLPSWTGKDALSLLEVAMHCVERELIENNRACADTPALSAYEKGFTGIVLSPINNADGKLMGAMAEVTAEGVTQTLRIRMMLDGMLDPQMPIEIKNTASEE